MASSSVSQEDHDVEHEFALASRRAKVRSARANRSVNNAYPMRGKSLWNIFSIQVTRKKHNQVRLTEVIV